MLSYVLCVCVAHMDAWLPGSFRYVAAAAELTRHARASRRPTSTAVPRVAAMHATSGVSWSLETPWTTAARHERLCLGTARPARSARPARPARLARPADTTRPLQAALARRPHAPPPHMPSLPQTTPQMNPQMSLRPHTTTPSTPSPRPCSSALPQTTVPSEPTSTQTARLKSPPRLTPLTGAPSGQATCLFCSSF
jgi:hypothetical protein